MLEYTPSYAPGNDIIAGYYLLQLAEYGDRILEYDKQEPGNAYVSLFDTVQSQARCSHEVR